jgi:hypothetical protein
MNNKLIVAGAAVLAVAAILYVLTRPSPDAAAGPIGPTSVISPIANNPAIAANLLPEETQTIIQSGDAAKCEAVNAVSDGVNYETVCRNNIAWNTAQANLDIHACDGLDNKLMSVADCQRSVVGKLIAKDTSLAVCDQFVSDIKNFCVNNYWSMLAVAQHDPSLCQHLNSSSSQASASCEENVLLASISSATSTPECSVFTGAAETDCTNYTQSNCQALTVPQLQQFCLQKRK